MFRADLHCHSTESDGVFSPLELIKLAKQKGLSGLSITDHDTLSYCPSIQCSAQEHGIRLLLGVELSSAEPGFKESVHILGYGFRGDSPQLKEYCDVIKKRRKERNCKIVDRLKAIDVHVDLDALYERHPTGAVGRPHFALEIVSQGKAKTIDEAFGRFLGDNKQCYVSMKRPSVEEAIRVIHRAGGFAILAHPHLFRDKKLLAALFQRPFDGLETHYARMSIDRNAPFEKIAKEKRWICSAGSDFHGYSHSLAQLGDSWVDEVTFEHLIKGRSE